MFFTLLLATFTYAAPPAPVPQDVKLSFAAIAGNSEGKTASEMIAVLRKLGVISTLSNGVETFQAANGQVDRSGFGTCNPEGPGDYLANFDVIDTNSEKVIQQLRFENRGCEAHAPAKLLDEMMTKFGVESIGTAVHLGTMTYWITSIDCTHDTGKPPRLPDICEVMINNAGLVPGSK